MTINDGEGEGRVDKLKYSSLTRSKQVSEKATEEP